MERLPSIPILRKTALQEMPPIVPPEGDLNAIDRFRISLERYHPCPERGRHQWMFGRACWAAELGLDPAIVIEEITRRLNRPPTDKLEVQRQVAAGFERATKTPSDLEGVSIPRSNSLGPYSEEALRYYCHSSPDYVCEDWLRYVSPVRPSSVSPLKFLAHLTKPGESVVIVDDPQAWAPTALFTRTERGYRARMVDGSLPDTSAIDAWLECNAHQSGIWWLCQPVVGRPVPVEKPSQLFDSVSKDDRLTWRGEPAVTSWRWLVLETDIAPPDLWLRFLCVTRLPISAIYSSGGRGLHAIVRLNAVSKADWDRAVHPRRPLYERLGADTTIWSAVRLSRLPQCPRASTGSVQELLYLDPATHNKSGSIIHRHPGPF